jgi:hypothetical protein
VKSPGLHAGADKDKVEKPRVFSVEGVVAPTSALLAAMRVLAPTSSKLDALAGMKS